MQTDLKKILAYSTISQLGYMFLGLGCGAFSAAIFHLMTHAFFKACLFLCAGSVMHALSGELNVFKMGGLRKHMPITSRDLPDRRAGDLRRSRASPGSSRRT